MQMGHLAILIVPARILGLDGDDAALHIVHIVLVLTQGHADDSHIDLHVDALLVETFLQDITGFATNLSRHLHRLGDRLDGLRTEVQDKIFRNMSKRAANMLKEDMEFMGPVRLKDVEEAQQKIVSTIRRLEDSGEIVIARSGEDELVV